MEQTDNPASAFERQMAELAELAPTAASIGECDRLDVLIEEARSRFWAHSAQDFDARNFMWQARFDAPHDAVQTRAAMLSAQRGIQPPAPIVLEAEGPTADTFFDYPGGQVDKIGHPNENLVEIAETERRLQIRIDEPLRSLLAGQNGGYTDFIFHPKRPLAPLSCPWDDATGFQSFWDNWLDIVPSELIASVQHWTSVESHIIGRLGKLDPVHGQQDQRWRNNVDGLDRLVIVSLDEHKHTDVQTLLCLDYRTTPDHPGIVVLDEVEPFGGPLRECHAWPSASSFFQGLRRRALEEIDGVVRRRGRRIVEIFDDNNRWRAPGFDASGI